MKIDDAIGNLIKLKNNGVYSIIQSVWTAEIFNVPEDEKWIDICKKADNDRSLYDTLWGKVTILIEDKKLEDEEINKKKLLIELKEYLEEIIADVVSEIDNAKGCTTLQDLQDTARELYCATQQLSVNIDENFIPKIKQLIRMRTKASGI